MSRRERSAIPRIGITTSMPFDRSGSIHRKMLPYVRAVERAGGEVTLLPNDVQNVATAIASFDGFLFSGGVDVDPKRYGGSAQHSNSEAAEYDDARDAFEIALALAVRESGIPTLAICRGLQVANVAFGGTLVEDLHDAFGGSPAIAHRQTENGQGRADYGIGHLVAFERDSRLATIFGTECANTNSLHHQGVRDVAPALTVVGETSDGVVEACELVEPHPFFLAVQWHPEELTGDANVRLFSAFVEAARAAAMTGAERA